jgi:hypothetical protein
VGSASPFGAQPSRQIKSRELSFCGAPFIKGAACTIKRPRPLTFGYRVAELRWRSPNYKRGWRSPLRGLRQLAHIQSFSTLALTQFLVQKRLVIPDANYFLKIDEQAYKKYGYKNIHTDVFNTHQVLNPIHYIVPEPPMELADDIQKPKKIGIAKLITALKAVKQHLENNPTEKPWETQERSSAMSCIKKFQF